jgi:large conductance mechanosensitive channel
MKYKFENQKSFIGENELKKYKEFAFKEDMMKMSIAFILGASFNKIITGISDLILMPIINFITLKTGDLRGWTFVMFEGLTFEIGKFLGVLVDFFLISILLYFLYFKILKNINNSDHCSIKVKECPLCKSEINYLAIKCPECTGDLNV